MYFDTNDDVLKNNFGMDTRFDLKNNLRKGKLKTPPLPPNDAKSQLDLVRVLRLSEGMFMSA